MCTRDHISVSLFQLVVRFRGYNTFECCSSKFRVFSESSELTRQNLIEKCVLDFVFFLHSQIF